jgi:hypothetical protein
MTIDERIVQLLVPAVLRALHPEIAPDKEPRPYSTFHLSNGENLVTHDAVLPQTQVWLMQFSTFSERYGEARTIGTAIETALVGYTDAAILGVTPVRKFGMWDDIAKLHGWILELQITELT